MRRLVLHSVAAAILGFAGTLSRAQVINSVDPRVAELTTAVKSTDSKTQEKAFITLMEMGPKAAGAVPVLIECLDDPRSLTRDFAISTLGGIGAAASSALPKLGQISESDPDQNIRELARSAIGTIRAAGAQATPAPVAPAPVPLQPAPTMQRPGMTVFSFLGRFKNDKISVDIRADGNRYSGTILFGTRQFTFTGDIKGVTLSGKFTIEDGTAFDFTAVYDVANDANGSLLKFMTDGKTQVLNRVQPNASPNPNPLAVRTSLTPANQTGESPALTKLMTVVRDPEKGFMDGDIAGDKFVSESRDGSAAVQPLLDVLRTDREPANKFKACMVLGKLKSAARPAVPALIGMLKDETVVKIPTGVDKTINMPLAAAPAGALGDLGADAREALPALKEAAEKCPFDFVRQVAAESVQKIENAPLK